VNLLDLVILAVGAGAAMGGYRLGFVARAASWFGMVVGIGLAARIAEPVLEAMDRADDGRLLLTASALLIGGAFLGQAFGLLVGARLHHSIPDGRARDVDRVGGAAAGLLGVIVAVWLLAPAMARVPGEPARLARGSVLAQAVADALPKAPDSLRSIEELVGTELPDVLDAFDRAPELGPPPAESGITQEVADRVAASTVKVEAEACGRLQDGSGALLADDLVVTNAHVVAGADDIIVQRHPDGEPIEASLVAFDPQRDLAVLHVPGIERAPLPIAAAEAGQTGAVFGHPGGGDLELSPYQVGEEVTATGRDIYGSSQTRRQVLFLASELRPGDSGGALVDPAGEVVGVAFAIAPDDPNVAYALTVDEVQAVLGGQLVEGTDPGPCLR
jgi:S1-C subfamily serine protease